MTTIQLIVTVQIDGNDSDSAGDNLRKIIDEAGLNPGFLEMIRQEIKTQLAAADWRIVSAIALTEKDVQL